MPITKYLHITGVHPQHDTNIMRDRNLFGVFAALVLLDVRKLKQEVFFLVIKFP